ncbi:MAG: tRNA (adenosine(37)-N6)-threonylcarbamoyltransferase complex ATPase subunit type 1 TsaE [Thermodesulfovibrionales bacterium]
MRVTSSSPCETEEIGRRLGRLLKAGDIVCLFGDLGTGKTTMVKGIASSFGLSSRDVTSASFTVIAGYPGNPPFYHIDLYRIESSDDLESTGIWDIIGGESVSVIEWAERLGDEKIGQPVRVYFEEPAEDVRVITIEGINEETWSDMQARQA